MATKSGAGGLVYSVVAIAIIVLIVSTVAVPIIEDAQKEQTSLINNSTQNYVSTTSDTEPVVITWNVGTLTVNGAVVDHGTYTVVAAGLNCILYVESNTATTMVYVDSSNPSVLNRIVSLTWDSGSITVVNPSNIETTYLNVGNIYYINNDGNIGMFVNGTDAHIDHDQSVLYVSLRTGSYIGTNTIVNGVVSAAGIPFKGVVSGTVVDPSAYSIVPEVTEDESGLSYTLGKLSVSYEYNETSYGPFFNGVVFAPLAYHTITESEQSIINLLAVIPVLLFLVPVMFAVRMIQTRRN